MNELYIYLILVQIIIIIAIIGIRLLFNHLENKKIKSILKYIDMKSKENKDGTADRLQECIDILKQSNKEGVR